jgi:ComF family protein
VAFFDSGRKNANASGSIRPADRISEWVFPSNIYCIACGSVIDATAPYALCDGCVRAFAWNTGRVCAKCGKSLEGILRADEADGRAAGLCFDCEAAGRVFGKGYSCVTYEGNARETVRALKYRDQAHIADKLAEMMWDRIRSAADAETGEMCAPDLIIPVPMHIIKRRKRGYDQAALIAKRLAARMGLPYDERCIARSGQTSVMSSLRRDERKRNVHDMFALAGDAEKRVAGKDILLVDDVFTTGSTADACASVLLAAGAANVDVYTFASGANVRIGYATGNRQEPDGSVVENPCQLRAKGST